uniref:Uncharacterized protein n=1 Tax=Mucochytrium quahogii TaxID=96639 RepID=A0A7S2R7G4_9STRA
MKAYVLTELGISSREPNQLVTAFMILVECGGYDTSLLKKLAIEIVVSTVNSGEIQLAFDWMKTVAKLGQMIELIRSEAPVFATAVPLQKDGMILHMTRGMASTFDTEGKNVQSLVYQYLSLLDSERLIAEDLECYEKCQALATFFVETLPKFKESCCFRKDLVPSGIQETEQGVWSISGQLQGSLEGSPPQVCVQWHCDDNKWSMYVGVINPTDGGTLLVEQKQMLWEDVRRMGTLFSRIRHEMEEAGESAPTEKYNADEAFASALGTLLSSNDEDIPTVPCVLDTVRLFEDAFDPSKGMLHVGETRELGKGKTAVDPTNESGDILVKWWNKFATHK